MKIDYKTGKQAIYGGLLLGGGGGGSLEGGLEVLEKAIAFGGFDLCDIDNFCDDEIVVTSSLVGSPASKNKYISDEHYDKVYKLLQGNFSKKITGIITNEMGAQAVTNGWIVAAKHNLPFIDAPCNGRAHPTGEMGSIGLSKQGNYITIQTAAGGKHERSIGLVVSGSINSASKVIISASIEAGGFVTVLRNPIDIGYVRKNAAIGAVKKTIEIGKVMLEHAGKTYDMIKELNKTCGIEYIAEGIIEHFKLNTEEGLDLGVARIKCDEKLFEISIYNEYITLEEKEGKRIATFPDLISLIDKKSGLPVISAELHVGMEVIICINSREHMILGSSMYDKYAISNVEKVIGKKLR